MKTHDVLCKLSCVFHVFLILLVFENRKQFLKTLTIQALKVLSQLILTSSMNSFTMTTLCLLNDRFSYKLKLVGFGFNMNIMSLTPSLTCSSIPARAELDKPNGVLHGLSNQQMSNKLLEYFIKSRVFIDPKTIDQQSKDPINTLQNNNFIETMKHINS